MLTIAGDLLARWLFGSFHASPAAESPRWRFRWTMICVLLVVFTFAAGIALVATFHQVWWLVSSKEPLVSLAARGRQPEEPSRRIISSRSAWGVQL